MRVAGYSRMQIVLHWLIAVLIGVNYVVSDDMGRALRTVLNGGTASGATVAIHVWVGIAVLALMVLRLALRVIRGAPPEPDGGGDLMRRAGRWAHWALYALLFALPALGMAAWYLGIPSAGDLHELTMNLVLILVGLHAAAALFHHYILRDGLIGRMLRPG